LRQSKGRPGKDEEERRRLNFELNEAESDAKGRDVRLKEVGFTTTIWENGRYRR